MEPGTRLGTYEILEPLGAGGMGEVYRAHDSRLRRDVAVKLLPQGLSADPDRLARFKREARALASLNHSHVATVHGFEEVEGTSFIVMELLEGPTLADRLREGPLSVERTVELGLQVARALEAAHSQGIVHRDLKPANVKITPEGHAKVLDFGLAKSLPGGSGAAATEMATATMGATEAGVVLGTAAYMSPEQARGEAVDRRTDVWALGCLLYEMLTGSAAYGRATMVDTLAAVIDGEPDWQALPADTPRAVRTLLRRCLRRDPDRRLHDVADVRIELEDARAGAEEASAAAAEAVAGAAGPRGGWTRLAAGAALGLILGGVLATIGLTVVGPWSERPSVPDRAAIRRDVGLAHDAPMQMGTFRNFSVAPDGSFVLYEADAGATTQLWYRSLAGEDSRPLPGTEGAFGTPRVSPDGSRVAFASGRELRIARIDGGPVVTVAEVQDPYGGGWLGSDLLFFADEDGHTLRWIDPDTGPARRVAIGYCIQPQLLADGERVLCGGGARKVAYVRDLDPAGELRFLRVAGREGGAGGAALRGSDFRIVDDDYLLYMSVEGTLMGSRIEDADSLTVGRSVSLVPSVRREAYSGAGQFEVTRDGTLVYVPGPNADVVRFVRLTAQGRLEPLPIEAAAHLRFSISPDGRRLATVSERAEGQQLRVYGLDSGTVHTLDEGFKIGQPRWSPGGDHLVYPRWDNESEESLLKLSLSSPAGPELLLRGDPALNLWPASYLADDLLLLGSGGSGWPTMVMDPTTAPPTFDPLDLETIFLALSPDARWLAYQANGIQIQPWPERDRRYLVDQNGYDPRWLAASELAYWTTGTAAGSSVVSFHRVRIDAGADPPVGPPELLFSDPRFADTPGPSFDVTPEGELLYPQSPSENRAHYLRIVPGWVQEMKRAVDEANRRTGTR